MVRRAHGLLLSAALTAGVVALASPASAQTPRERLAVGAFAIPRDPSGQRAAAAVGAVVRDRVDAHDRLRLIEPARALSGDPRTREEETIDRARAALADGRKAYDALGLDDAIARLGQAVSLYQQSGPLLGDLGEMKTALAYLGAALTLRGSAEEGVSTFYELLTVDPSFTLPSKFPPTVGKVFDGAVDRLNDAKSGSVEIYSTPPHAAVFLDGEYRGVTPLTVDALTSGTHYVRIEKDGYVTFGGPLDVAPTQRITSQTRLRDIRRGAELRDLLARTVPEVEADAMGGNLRELARLLVADTLVVLAVSQSGKDASVTGSVYDAPTATRLATERAVVALEGPTFARDVDALVSRLAAAAVSRIASSGGGGGAVDDPGGSAFGLSPGAGTGRLESGPSPTGGPPVTSVRGDLPQIDDGVRPGNAIGISMVAVGGAGLIAGTVLAILANQTHNDFVITPQASPDLARIQDDGKKKALAADLCFGIGGTFAVAGAITLIVTALDRPGPSELLSAPVVSISPLGDDGLLVSAGGALPWL
jgi:hypothetical protein